MLTFSSVKCIKYYCFNGPCCVKLLFLAFQYKREVRKNREHQINVSAGIPASFLLYVQTSDFQEEKRKSYRQIKFLNSSIISAHGFKNTKCGFPWWRSGWESACQFRGHGFEPWSGKIPHAAEQLGLWVTITEPARLEPVLRNKRGRDSERPAHRDEEWPPLAARESPRTETKTQHSHK